MFRKPDSGPRLPDALPRQGDASELLDFVIANHAIRTQTVDLLADAIAQRDDGLKIGYQLLSDVRSYLKFANNYKEYQGRRDVRNKLVLLIHPEEKGKQPVTLATQEDRHGLIGWAPTLFEPTAVNFTLVHGQGFGESAWEELEKIKGVRCTGSHNALDLVIGNKRITPKTPRIGDGRSDVAMVASLSIKNIVHTETASGYHGRDTIVDADWPKGWQVYGLTDVYAEHKPQERSRELEQKLMTPDEIKSRIEDFRNFLKNSEEKLGDLYWPNSYPNLRGYQKNRKINDLLASIAEDERLIVRLEQSLQDSSLSITPADLGIQIWV